MKIKQIWKDLSNDNSLASGLLFRRYSGAVISDVYVALQHPEKLLCIYFLLNETIDVNLSSFSNLQEIKVEFYNSPTEIRKKILVFKLLTIEHEDIFAVLCEDLISNISAETDDKKIVRVILNRFEKWKSLFSKIGSIGLNSEEQRGLYGELFFLRKFLETRKDFISVINSWIGPEKEVRDFQSDSWAVEVKTTHGNNHQKIHINNERQLDFTNLNFLCLNHLSLEVLRNSQETLNSIIDSILEKLKEDAVSLNKFKCKLFEVGYFDIHRNLYENVGYKIRQDIFYKVDNDFPRIEEKEIRAGVGDVKYSIILTHCDHFQISEIEVFEILNS